MPRQPRHTAKPLPQIAALARLKDITRVDVVARLSSPNEWRTVGKGIAGKGVAMVSVAEPGGAGERGPRAAGGRALGAGQPGMRDQVDSADSADPAEPPDRADPADDLSAPIERAQGGSTEAFTEIVARYSGPIRAYLARLLDDDEQARDLTQEVFVQAWRKLPELRQPEHLRAWLYRVATNRAHSALRRRRIVRWVSLEAHRDAPSGEHPAIAPRNAGQALAADESGFEERVAESEAVGRALRAVPLTYRECLLLHLTHGFSVAEIAAQFDLSPTAVRTRLSRGMMHLRAAYARENA